MTAVREFAYEARGGDGRRLRGRLPGASAEAVAAELAAQGAVATSIREAGRGLQREISFRGGRPAPKELIAAVRQLATLVEAGVSLTRALDALAQQSASGAMQNAIRGLLRDVMAGSSLSAAIAAQGRTFPPIMQHMVRAGESAGFLDGALKRIALVLESEQKTRDRVRAAMVYPAVVLSIVVVIVIVMLVFVVPIFEQMFADLGGELPFVTRVLVVLSANIWWILPSAVLLGVLGVGLYRRARRDPELVVRIDGAKLRLPVFGDLNRKVAMSRFCRNLGMLIGAGVPMLEAIDVVQSTIGNAKVASILDDARRAVRDGRVLSDPLAAAPEVFPPMLTHMLEVGEETGRVEEMLGTVAGYYDAEIETTANALTSLLEPLLVVVLGVVVGAMVVALYLPMFTIYEQIG